MYKDTISVHADSYRGLQSDLANMAHNVKMAMLESERHGYTEVRVHLVMLNGYICAMKVKLDLIKR